MNFDLAFLMWLQETMGPGAQPLWTTITRLGTTQVAIVVVSLALWLKGTRMGLRIALFTTLGNIVVDVLKVLIAQPRPYYVSEAVQAWHRSDGFGMPSGHATNAMTTWGSLALLHRWWALMGASVIILLIGLSRIYFGVHAPSQVVAGWLLGSALVLGLLWAEKPLVRWLRTQGVATQLGLVLLMDVLMLGYLHVTLPQISAGFVVPDQWTQRYEEVQRYVARKDGVSEAHLRELQLFDSFGLDEIGMITGVVLAILFVINYSGYEDFTQREQLANLVIGAGFLATLMPLTGVVEAWPPVEFLFWIALPLLLGLAVPALGRAAVQKVYRSL